MNSEYGMDGVNEVFSLHAECGLDHDRVARERAEAEAYSSRCQKVLEKCPGFIGCDAPPGPGKSGRVVVEPGLIAEAMAYLKKRYATNKRVDVDAGRGLCVDIVTRQARGVAKRCRVSFEKPVQFELQLNYEPQ